MTEQGRNFLVVEKGEYLMSRIVEDYILLLDTFGPSPDPSLRMAC